MKPFLQQAAHLLKDRDARVIGGLGAGLILAVLFLCLILRSRRPSAEEAERRRRERLAAIGRITDGVILDAHTTAGESSAAGHLEVLVYSYRIAGVTYNCAQDVSRLHDRIPLLQPGESVVDQSVQIRYDPHDPGNSILVSESWTGLWKREGSSDQAAP